MTVNYRYCTLHVLVTGKTTFRPETRTPKAIPHITTGDVVIKKTRRPNQYR